MGYIGLLRRSDIRIANPGKRLALFHIARANPDRGRENRMSIVLCDLWEDFASLHDDIDRAVIYSASYSAASRSGCPASWCNPDAL